MNHIKLYEEFPGEIPGGRAQGLDIEGVAKHHGVAVEELIKQLEVGKAVEAEHTPDPEVAIEIALDHLYEDPDYYTKLIKAGVVDEPEALRIYNDLYEGDWWDNDPSAPWNQDDREPDESMEIEYKPEQQLFELVREAAGWLGILKGKGPEVKGYWVVNLDEIPEEYKLRLDYGDDAEVEFEVTDDTIANYATDLYKEAKPEERTSQAWLDDGTLIAPLDTQEVIDDVIDKIEYALAPGYRDRGEYWRPAARETKANMKAAIFFLERLKPGQV